MTIEHKKYFRKVHKKIYTRQVLSRGECNLVDFAFSNNWSIEKTVGKINQGHGIRWEDK